MIYEAKVYLGGTGAVLTSTEIMVESYYHGNEVLQRRVLKYPPKRMGEITLYDFGFITFRLVDRPPIRIIVDKDENPQQKEIWIGGAIVGSGRNLTDKVFFLKGVELKLPGIIRAESTAKTLAQKDHTNMWITYYAPKGQSFGFISRQHIKYLPKVGLNIYNRTTNDLIWGSQSEKSDWGILHPIFYEFQRFQKYKNMGGSATIEALKKYHRNVGGFDVADSDRISQFAVDIANGLDLIMVPSECSKKAYLESGVKSRVEVVPHGLSELYNAPSNPFKKIPCDGVIEKEIPEEDITVLFFMLHSAYRKGADVVYKAMSKILGDRSDVHLIVKSVGMNQLCTLPRSMCVSSWLSETDLIRLYDSADILLSPSRGGGFELNALEGLARGLIAVTSDWPAIREYADPYVLTVKNTGKKVQPLHNNPIHIGHGTDPDPKYFYRTLDYAIKNLDYLKEKAEERAPEIRKKYSWIKIAKIIRKHLGRNKP